MFSLPFGPSNIHKNGYSNCHLETEKLAILFIFQHNKSYAMNAIQLGHNFKD